MRYLLLSLFFSVPVFAQDPAQALRSRLQNAAADSDRIKIYLELSKYYTNDQPDSAVAYCNRGMQVAEKTSDRENEARLLLQMGDINITHHHTELARRFINESLSIFRQMNDKEGIAGAYDALGLLDAEDKNTAMATADMGNALKFYEDIHDSSGLLETYHGLGTVYEEKGDIEKALSYYLRVLVQYEHRAVKPEAYFVLLDRIGHLYLKKGNTDAALHYLEEGIHNSPSPAVKDTQLTLLNAEGKVYEQRGEKAKALQYYKRELDEAKKYSKPEEEARALISIAHVLKRQNAGQSLADLKTALHIASDLHEPKLEASIYQALAGVYQQQNDYREAMNALEEQHRLLDSLLNADTAKDIAAMDSSYMLESSREKISSLQQANHQEKTEISLGVIILLVVIVLSVLLWLYLRKVYRLNKELQQSNKIKDTLFSIIGHDLKGPAGTAAQMFAIMENEDFSPDELKVMISELRKQTAASFELLSALFEWGKSQLKGVKIQPEGITLQPLIQKNIDLLAPQAILKNITISNSADADLHVYADPNHVDFIIRNLLSNAIKFTPDGGSIGISADRSNDMATIAVKDTGVGISPAQQHDFIKGSLHVSFGTRGEKGSGLGLLLTKEFIAANGGKIWLTSEPGRGTTFYCSLPLSN